MLKLLMRLRDCGLPLPACGVLLSPFTDLTCSGNSMSANAGVDPMFGRLPRMEVRFYLGASNARDPGCSPLFGNFSGLPPLLAQVGSTERLLDDSLRLAPKVERAGGELSVEVWEGMPHVWHLMGLPESQQAVETAGRFMRQHVDANTHQARIQRAGLTESEMPRLQASPFERIAERIASADSPAPTTADA